MENLNDLPIRRGTLLLVKNWLEAHDEAIKREFRSAKQYEGFLYRFFDMLMRDSSAMYWLIEGSLEIWYNKETGGMTMKRGEGFNIDTKPNVLPGQLDIEEELKNARA